MSQKATIYEIVALFLYIGDEESVRRFQDIIMRNEGQVTSIDTQIEMEDGNQITQTTPIIMPVTTTNVNNHTTYTPIGSGCDISRFSFPGTHHSSYIQYQGNISEMISFSGCAWIRQLKGLFKVSGTLFSYCASTSISISDPCLTLKISFSDPLMTLTVHFNGKKYRTFSIFPITNRTHFCIVRSETKHIYYIDGQTLATRATDDSYILPGNGVLILGHGQYGPISGSNPGEQSYSDEGFQGDIERFEVWDRTLTASEISDIYTSGVCGCQRDATITFDRHNSRIHGPVKHDWSDDCDEDDI